MNPTNDPQDDELRASLRALRHEGERNAPSFSHTWRAAKARRQAVAPAWRLAWAIATVAAVAILALIIVPRQSKQAAVATVPVETAPVTTMHQEAAPAAVLAVTDEGLPTDFLLTTNNDDSVARVAGEIDALLRP